MGKVTPRFLERAPPRCFESAFGLRVALWGGVALLPESRLSFDCERLKEGGRAELCRLESCLTSVRDMADRFMDSDSFSMLSL